MTDQNKPCQGGCGKVRSILHSDDPTDWLCYECRTAKGVPVDSDEHLAVIVEPIVREICGDSASLSHYKVAITAYRTAINSWLCLKQDQKPHP